MADGDRAPSVGNYRELRVWQQGMTLVEQVYRLTREFPSQEVYGLTAQMRRAAVSIPSNIAEGFVRESTREYLQHISVAQASLAELETQMEIAARLELLPQELASRFFDAAVSLSRQLFALRNALQRRISQSEK